MKNKLTILQVIQSIILAAICLLMISCANPNAQASKDIKKEKEIKEKEINEVASIAPKSIADSDIVLQIEDTVTKLPGGYPFKGAVVMHYTSDGHFTAQGTATMKEKVTDAQQAYAGTYQYKQTGPNTATEEAIDTSLHDLPYTTKYTFETPTSGKWQQDFNHGQLIFSGSFSLLPHGMTQQLAPETITGLNVALVIKTATSETLAPNVYAHNGLVLQRYAADGTLEFKGFGPGTVDSHGTYTYKKISANTAVEEVIQTNKFFTLPYTMVYTFETPTSGKWYQNLGNGFIKFHGTFDTFPMK